MGFLFSKPSSVAPAKGKAAGKAGEDPKARAGQKGGAGGAYAFSAIRDSYDTLEQVTAALQEAGLESSNLILAIDFTKSNQWTGKRTFNGRSLHYIDPDAPDARNPYMTTVEVIGKVLAHFDDDNLIPVLGFGDSTTLDRAVFPCARAARMRAQARPAPPPPPSPQVLPQPPLPRLRGGAAAVPRARAQDRDGGADELCARD